MYWAAQQTTDTDQAIIHAQSDVKSPYGWFAGAFLTSIAFGCIGGSVIVGTSQVAPVKVPTHRLIGKSPEYVHSYTTTYKDEMKHERLIHTSIGCVGGSAIAGLIIAYTYLYTYDY